MSTEKKTILVVEDEMSLSRIMVAKLSHQGYDVLSARDGAQGLDMALEAGPELIVLDLVMPHMGGLEMLDKLRRDPRGFSVPVIVLTNVGNTEQMDALKYGVNVIVKVKSETSLESLAMTALIYFTTGELV